VNYQDRTGHVLFNPPRIASRLVLGIAARWCGEVLSEKPRRGMSSASCRDNSGLRRFPGKRLSFVLHLRLMFSAFLHGYVDMLAELRKRENAFEGKRGRNRIVDVARATPTFCGPKTFNTFLTKASHSNSCIIRIF
jgi:hypothetical protein